MGWHLTNVGQNAFVDFMYAVLGRVFFDPFRTAKNEERLVPFWVPEQAV